MRRPTAALVTLAICGILGALALLTRPGQHSQPHVWVTRSDIRGLTACASNDCGPYSVTLNWSGIALSGNLGYHISCSQSSSPCGTYSSTTVATVTASPYTFVGMDCAATFTLSVQPYNSGGNGNTYSSSYMSPACDPSTVVGDAGAPTPTCNYVVSAGSDPSSDLASASPGQTVCLANGTWSNGITLSSNITQSSPGVTLAAQHPGQAIIDGGTNGGGGVAIYMPNTVDNLTVEGLDTTDGFALWGPANNDTFIYNTMENWPSAQLTAGANDQDNSAIFSDAQTGSDTNIAFEYNQVDHAPQCLQVDFSGSPSNWTFSHNVCGPGMGAGSHYMQIECVPNVTVDNNTFEGPLYSGIPGDGAHMNILHWCGNTVDIENNIVWDAEDVAQGWLLGDDGVTQNVTFKNNLDIQDPGTSSGCPAAGQPDTCTAQTFSYGSQGGALSSANVLAENNTSWNSNTGVGSYGSSGGVSTAGSNSPSNSSVTVENNVMATYGSDGDFSTNSGQVFSGNVSADSSGNIASWSPCWQNQNWPSTNVTGSFDGGTGGPNNGSPWVAPPSNYYKPVTSGGCANDGVTSSAGYQTTLGP